MALYRGKDTERNGEITVNELEQYNAAGLYSGDFLLTWEQKLSERKAILKAATILEKLRRDGISPRVFESGLAISQFRDQSTRTRFSFVSACNLLGLTVQELDEGKSQVSHGETVRETANMISFMADVIGIRDDIFLGKGHAYMLEVAEAVSEGYERGVLEQRPSVVNLQCDIDHPTQCLADLAHLSKHFGGLEQLRGKTIAMSWAYSPSYGKPLSVPQGIIGLLTRFGMKVRLAHPEGYTLLPEIIDQAKQQAKQSGGSFLIDFSIESAFQNADVVYPKSWAPYVVMEERSRLLEQSDQPGLAQLEQRCLELNRRYMDWQCTEELMAQTNNALYLHCLPADISGVSCESGEVSAAVFDRFKTPLYRQAGNKPYIIAAIILCQRFRNPGEILHKLALAGSSRLF